MTHGPTSMKGRPQIAPDRVKLFVWDLDGTLWQGILAEGPVKPDRALLEMISRLNDHGVLNTICSKNDPERAFAVLKEFGVDHEFIMPRIALRPKGKMLHDLLADMRLRPVNAVFVDDNILNLREAEFYNPGIRTVLVEGVASDELAELLRAVMAVNRPDGRVRFRQYRAMEARHRSAAGQAGNLEFLRSIGLKVSFRRDWQGCIDRLDELVNRTNQLNYTKTRLTRGELLALLAGEGSEAHIIRASDDFGDHGIIGFVVVDRTENTASQFVFSCRVLNMGIEHYVWNRLGRPVVVAAGEVATPLDPALVVDWISETNRGAEISSISSRRGAAAKRFLIIGGCDLQQLVHFLQARQNGRIESHFNYPSPGSNFVAHRDSVSYLYGALHYGDEDRAFIRRTVPFVDEGFFTVPRFDAFDAIIYSPLIDYVQMEFASRSRPHLRAAVGDFTKGVTVQTLVTGGLAAESAAAFLTEWRALGPIGAEEFGQKLAAVFGAFCGRLFILTGAEKTVPAAFAAYADQHRALNGVVRAFARSRPDTVVVEIDEVIHGESDFAGSARHYAPVVFPRLAEVLARRSGDLAVRSTAGAWKARVVRKISQIARQLWFREW